jgi:hypothetical protein
MELFPKALAAALVHEVTTFHFESAIGNMIEG